MIVPMLPRGHVPRPLLQLNAERSRVKAPTQERGSYRKSTPQNGPCEMKVLTFFNNKGGVGKTTLTANIAAYLSLEMGKRVLVVDCDPQCNITQYLLGDQKTIDMYWPDKADKDETKTKTVMSVVQPIIDGDAGVNKGIKPMPKKSNRFGVDLLPGDLRFSLFEDNLSEAWNETLSGRAGGFRVNNWLSYYLEGYKNDYDIVLVDVSPSLGPINRSVMLSSDFFATPLGADAFSLLGIRNMSRWISGWAELYSASLSNAEKFNSGAIEKYNIRRKLPILEGYVGYTLQQYIAKATGGVKRPTKAYERILVDVPKEVDDHLKRFSGADKSLHLGDVPNLYSLIPLAQKVNSPIIALKTKDGLVGSQFSQVSEYKDIIGSLAHSISRTVFP